MRLHRLLTIAAAALLCAACGAATTSTGATGAPTSAPVATIGAISISAPWARATAMGGAASATAASGMGHTDDMGDMKTGATYMTIANSGGEADRLVAVSTDIAQTAELHTVIDQNGVMQMRPVEGGIEVPANGSVTLRPGSYHVMLVGLSKDLRAGDTVSLQLQFEKAGALALDVPVREQ